MHAPKTLQEAERYVYSVWADDPAGLAYNPTRCAAAVWERSHEMQCSRKPGHGPAAQSMLRKRLVEKYNEDWRGCKYRVALNHGGKP